MDLLIREAIEFDVTAIWQLNSTEMGYQFSFKATVENLSKLLCSTSDKIFVAVSDGLVVGYVHANDYDLIYAPHMKNIMGIAVFDEYKQRGIGSALLQRVEQWALETGASGIRLVSGTTRTDAHAFYCRCGYSGNKEQINFKKMF